MSFSDNLQNLRKRDNLTQDALADKLEVTKEAVSEWESGGGYPGIDKIIRICELFGCDMDTLVKGDIPAETHENDHKLKSLYEKTLNSVSTAFSAAIGIILLGLTALILISGRAEGTSYEKAFAAVGAAVLISGVAIAAPLFIVYGIKLTDFNRRHPHLPAFYTDDEVSSYFIKFGIGIGAGVVLLILGVIAALLVNALTEIKGVYIAAIVIGSIASAVPLFVFFGMRM
ncbi:MAG: helix-turn-helix transcriptional regulator, partial [Clostridia bacterium]|nr:helix-turn-helix transcriptional regulator [Clostridia bacterium]